MGQLKYSRVVLKISGEGFCKRGGFGLENTEVMAIARRIKEIASSGVELAIVVGAGNFLRGYTLSQETSVSRATADYMGMLATVINALALQDTLEGIGVDTRVQSAIMMHDVAEPFIRRRCIRHLEKGRVVILAAGTGNPFFSTDTCAALRASELNADALLKATKVDGIYSADPQKHPDATRYDSLTYEQVIQKDLKVIDVAAVTLCRDNNIPIVVFNLKHEGNIRRVIEGEAIGTTVGVS